MAAPFAFAHRIDFSPENADALLREVPAAPGVFALRGEDPASEPYLTRAADLRRRMRRLLAPPEALDENGNPVLSKRLNLRNRVRFIEYTRTGSDFESTLILYKASRKAFGAEETRRRLRLYAPYFLRVTMSHQHPRVYSTNRLSKKSLAESFGPFPSRAAAERYSDAVLDLFLLRRCYEDLEPHPDHPGCVYGEMHKCMRPCQQGAPQACTPAEYAAEAARVHAFFTTRGQSLLDEVATQREAASEAMDFEAAATLHKHWEKVRAAALLADEIVRPVEALRAVILQEAAPLDEPIQTFSSHDPAPTLSSRPERSEVERSASVQPQSTGFRTDDAAVFLLEHGHLAGPERLSTLGVRAVREQTAVGSSLFAQPLMLAPVPLDEPASNLSSRPESASFADEAERPASPSSGQASASTTTPEERARAVLNHLAAETESSPETATEINDLCDALSLFRRWYYRPEKQRTGEVFLPNPDHGWPIRRILNGAARVVLGPPTAAAPVDREAAKTLKTKIIHAGREGVEREVHVLPKRTRTRKAITPNGCSGVSMSEIKYTTERLTHWRTVSHQESFERTLSDIEKYGWHAMLITGETWSRFAYTVGAYDALGVPEIIVVGLTEKTAHIALKLAIEALQSGVDLTVGRHPDIIGEVGVEARPVSRKWYEHVMYRTNWYYNGDSVPVLQIVYPDLEGHFQWEENFNDYFLQPMLSSEVMESHRERDFWALNDLESALFNWKFPDPPHTKVYLSGTVKKKEEAVTYVSHDTSDGAWQFFGDKMSEGGGPVISCFHHPIDDDRSIEELYDLPLGWYAVRNRPGDPWQRFKKPLGEND